MSGEEIDRDNVGRRVNGDGGVRRLSEPHENMNEPEGSEPQTKGFHSHFLEHFKVG